MQPITIATILGLSISTFAQVQQNSPAEWREQKRLIDLHQHINSTPEHLARAVRIMDAAGVGIGVNLSGGTVTVKTDSPSEFERNRKLANDLFPGRFALYMNLDYSQWDTPEFAANAIKQVEEGKRLGAAGLKEYKRLGLYLRDKDKNLLRIDDPKLDGVWKRCGELNMPVSIHVADPKAFWEPYDEQNERWIELKDHRSWWFGDPQVYPRREELLAALNRVVERHPNTTFVCVHFANNAEDLEWVERSLDKYPNMHADLAARVPEIGRHDPAKVRKLFEKHQDRILFATDFQVYDRLTLGSGGGGPGPTDADAEMFFLKHWRWLETNDRDFQHMTPIQGQWPISGIGLSKEVLRKVYFENAHRILNKALPVPVMRAMKVTDDVLERDLFDADVWATAEASALDRGTLEGNPLIASATAVRCLYSTAHLYFRFDAKYSELSTFEPPRMDSERVGLWDRDVVEVFLGTDHNNIKLYYEWEVAPSGEKLDLVISPEIPKVEDRLQWESGWKTDVRVDKAAKTWVTVMKIPLQKLSEKRPEQGTRWRLNLYRIDRAENAFVAWSPTFTRSYHTPERFGVLEFK